MWASAPIGANVAKRGSLTCRSAWSATTMSSLFRCGGSLALAVRLAQRSIQVIEAEQRNR